jgi:hypothetical protein
METKVFEITTINNNFINIDCKDGVFYSQDSVGNMEGFQCNFYEDEPEYESLLKDCQEICRIIKHMSATIDRIERKNN